MRSCLPATALTAIALAGCKADPPPDFTVRPGVEIATVLDAHPGDQLTLYDAEDTALITVIADENGQAHFAYVPDQYAVIDYSLGFDPQLIRGTVLLPGEGYYIQNDEVDPVEWSGRFTVLGIDDPVDTALFDGQVLDGVPWSPIDGPLEPLDNGFQYIETRDGTLLSVMVRFPDPLLYGEGPWPTVIEYSGYSPSRPDRPDSGSQIANALGYVTVGVNMRGTGCSDGVFDIFNAAQQADGYDIVEVVARQEWVLNHQVGMVGLSYPGITQLYVASTRPPSLAAVVPLSTIADAWEMQWPGGLYNEGFTRQWVEEREAQAEAGGQSWVIARIDEGDTTCEANQVLSSQSLDFETFFHAQQFRPAAADGRDLRRLVRQIEAPTYLGGAFQDEQTGAQWAGMVDHFDNSPKSRFVLQNGRHPDGYAPDAVLRWYEFLEFYVAERIPRLNAAVRLAGGAEFGEPFGISGYSFPADRFGSYTDFDDALAAYEAESRVRLLFESGAGGNQVGTPTPRYELELDTWPAPNATPITWFLGADGGLDASAGASGADAWAFDPDAHSEDFFGPAGYQLLRPLWDIDWTRFPEGTALAYETETFATTQVLAGPGVATLWVKSPVDDVHVQVTLTEVRPDGDEMLLQTGWLRLGHRATRPSDDLRIDRSYAERDYEPVPIDTWVQADVQIPSVAHAVRAGSRLRMIVSTPGRDHGTWQFEAPDYDGTPSFELGRGGDHASKLVLTTLPGITVPADYPACPSLRGQPCRAWIEIENTVAE